jgi:zinc transport system ATP-binding protein
VAERTEVLAVARKAEPEIEREARRKEVEPVLEVRGLTFGYGPEVVLDRVDLAIYPRDYLAIIGPNGGGKTTLVKLLLGLLQPWSGQVIDRLPAPAGNRGKFGYVPQFSTFDRAFPLRVEEAVLMGKLGARGLLRPYTREDRRDVAATLARLHLSELARASIRELSGGQLQRVLIARAVVSNPSILFLDEPTASIDAESREVLRALLTELNQRIPVVVVTHDVTSIASQVQHVACVNRRLDYHGAGELTHAALEESYGCPVELVAHGIPHRVLREH